ncbi:zinc finger protein 729-like isoform X2 [Paramacrobiotus metropolitanus]|nr:zinc finger protein 729-like isoform X2 [Paramacrobiotus metropolitanus]
MVVFPCCEPVEQIFCDRCQKWANRPCFSHTSRIPDTIVIPYSVASLPCVLYLDIPPDGRSDKAVFAKEAIPAQTVFGPLIGALSTDKPADAAFACGSATYAGLHYFLTESNQTTNWMKFVGFARNAAEQNLAAFEIHEASPLLSTSDAVSPTRTHVVFVTTKAVLPGDELKVAYSRVYSQAIGCIDPQKAQSAVPVVTADKESCGQENKDSSFTVPKVVTARLRSRIHQTASNRADWEKAHPMEPVIMAGEEPCGQENSSPKKRTAPKFVRPRSQLCPIQIGSIETVKKLLSLPRGIIPDPEQHGLVPDSAPTATTITEAISNGNNKGASADRMLNTLDGVSKSLTTSAVPKSKKKDIYADPAPKITSAKARKRQKLLEECMAMPNFLPPDDDPVANAENNLADVETVIPPPLVVPDSDAVANSHDHLADVGALIFTDIPPALMEPEVPESFMDSCDAKDDDTNHESLPFPEMPLEPDDTCQSLSNDISPEENRPVDECHKLLEEMSSLKSRAHLGLRRKGTCLVCGERTFWTLPDHLAEKHSEEDVQAVDDACFFCRRKFKNHRALLQHLNIAHVGTIAKMPDEASRATALEFMRRTGLLTYRCVKCNRTFPKKSLLDLHSLGHNSDPAEHPERKCSECAFVARSFMELIKHTSKHTLPSKARNPCLLCGAGIRSCLRHHMANSHPEAMPLIMETWKYQCPECRQKFARKFDLHTHVAVQHKGWQCVYCGHREAHGWNGFDEHVMEHKIDNAFPCVVCEKSFKKYHRLCIHIRDRHGADSVEHADMVSVAEDSKTNSVPPAMVERAIEMIRKNDVFFCYCRECHKSFATFELLDLHQLQHKNPDTLEDNSRRDCPACEFQATSFAELVNHVLQHALRRQDQRPCLFCGKIVSRGRVRPHILQKHPAEMQRITETWEYPCAECPEKFKTPGFLEYHTKSQHKGFQCWYCAKVLYSSHAGGSHAAEHRVNGKFPCPACDKILANYPQVNNHYRKCHDATRMKTCSVCQTVCFGDNKLDEHMFTCHGIPSETAVKTKRSAARVGSASGSHQRTCSFCKKEFKNYASMHYHKITKHLGRNPNLKPKVRTQCDECQQMFACDSTLRKHKR